MMANLHKLGGSSCAYIHTTPGCEMLVTEAGQGHCIARLREQTHTLSMPAAACVPEALTWLGTTKIAQDSIRTVRITYVVGDLRHEG
jgi:hypothetical protein